MFHLQSMPFITPGTAFGALKSQQFEDQLMRAPKTICLTILSAVAIYGLISSSFQQWETSTAHNKAAQTKGSTLNSQDPTPSGSRPRLDVAFCIDTTSSMQGEIDSVKAKVKSMVKKITTSKDKPIVRVGLVAYRDKGDDYVTKVFPLSDDIDQVVNDISELRAEGGGDGPEAVDCGLHSAINELQWNTGKKTAKLIFLIGDAPPHRDTHDYDWKTESKNAIAQGIHINTIACDGLESYEDEGDGIKVFKQIARFTNGNFEPLSYHTEIVDANGKHETLITSGGKTYTVNSTEEDAWKDGADSLVASGVAVSSSYTQSALAPTLQGATNGSIGPQGSEATYITGVNTAGTLRFDNNLDAVMLRGAQEAIGKIMK